MIYSIKVQISLWTNKDSSDNHIHKHTLLNMFYSVEKAPYFLSKFFSLQLFQSFFVPSVTLFLIHQLSLGDAVDQRQVFQL